MPTRKSVHPQKWEETSNRNFLSVVGFKFLLERCPKVDFFCNQANIPDVTLGVAQQATYLKNIPVPGDKLQYGALNLSFMVDEDMENYLQIYQWITSLGFPESLDQYQELRREDRFSPIIDAQDPLNERSDATLMIINSDYNPSVKIKFKDMFPVSLSSVPFNATSEQQQYYTAQATFQYTIFDVIDVDGKKV
mgnify:CR=1 FL=1|tara:strand:+ start:783 stop:1361 length:579 start_codon:yes stop_codon:yes gene_type:complete